jgi:1,4-alpha-glucan branching enzyme
MIKKAAATTDGMVYVIFELPASVGAEQVHLVGDFNGWDRTSTPMCLDCAAACWQVTLALEAGGRYRFRYLVDGRDWLNDWHADDFAENPYGSYDSVISLVGFGE